MYVLLALAMLSVLVVTHELGHFLAARACGIAVQEFSVGMGPLLLKRNGKHGTQFSLRALPIGGFCMFYGEDQNAQEKNAFARASVPKRAITIASGPMMNFVVAFLVVVFFVSVLGVEVILPVVGELEENARASGLMIGDELLEVDGVTIRSSSDVIAAINAAQGEQVVFTVLRDGELTTVPLAPFYDEAAQRYRVGFSFAMGREHIPVWESVPFAASYCVSSVQAIIDALAGIFSSGRGVEDMTGIVGTVYVIQDATRTGGIDIVLQLLAMISVNLGVMNLLPIPGLDGSKLLFLLAEGLRGKPLNERIEGALTMAGFALIFGLMIVLTYKDLMQILTGRL